MSDREIRIILDTSAILAYTKGSIDVGEVICEVGMEGASVGLPVPCLAEAALWADEDKSLQLLVNHPATTVWRDKPAKWQGLANYYSVVGRLDAASAAFAASMLDVDVLTATAGLYAGLPDGGDFIEF